mgnify:CR=1 FL=1
MFLYKYSTVTRDELAKKLNLSQRQLHRILLKQYGKTFSELKREARLNKARELLQNGKTYEEAVAAVGYSDMRSFLKLIKKKVTSLQIDTSYIYIRKISPTYTMGDIFHFWAYSLRYPSQEKLLYRNIFPYEREKKSKRLW